MTKFLTHTPNGFDLPRRIARIGELAYNLWWTWNPDATRLFARLDYDLWESLAHNPILMLRQVGRSALNAAAQNKDYLAMYDRVFADFDLYQSEKKTWAATAHPEMTGHPVAYFSMEYGLHETLPIYSGGLGVLAGDHLKEASDLGLPFVAVGFLYSQGYFNQHISEDGWQEAINNPIEINEHPFLPVFDADGERVTVAVEFPDRVVKLQIWEVRVGRVPLYLLDSNVATNSEADRTLSARLYWSDLNFRVAQEVLLGVGGVRALRTLGYNPLVWHMNEGHAAFLTLERARELVASGRAFADAIAETRSSNIFTTHTPVPAGNDEFPVWLMDKHLAALWPQLGINRDQFIDLARNQQSWGETFSMGILALKLAEGRNAVSELHGRVSRKITF
jgi:starch phosphorylase